MALTYFNIFYLSLIFILFYSVKNEMTKMRILLWGSLAFYTIHEAYLTPLLLGISLLSYFTGHLLFKYKTYKKKILFLFFLILGSLYIPLKYNESFASITSNLFDFEGLRWLYLPLGLSFYSFKTMTYILDIYYEKSVPQRSPEKYLLFVSYFPQIFCGPIMGADEFFSQLHFKNTYDCDEIIDGLRLMAIGMFKKIVLANNLLLIIQNAFYNSSPLKAGEWILISILTRFYIYYDFSGYSDISNGASLLFGIKVKKNFDQPFRSKSITEFWRRWHISLSSWIRDYVYYPLVSKFSTNWGIYLSLVCSFIFLGLWHGDHLSYLLYGLVNGLAVAASTYFAKKNRSLPPKAKYEILFERACLYLFLIFLPSLLLMSNSNDVLKAILESFRNPESWFGLDYFKALDLSIMVISIVPMFMIFEFMLGRYGEKLRLFYSTQVLQVRIAIIFVIIFTTFVLMTPEVNYKFLYQGF